MNFKDFKYVDIALGGAMKRNNVVSLEYEFNISKTQHNCYTTMFRFKKEFKQLVESTGSVRGCNEMSCWSDYLWFDIDSDDLNVSYKHALLLVEGFKSMGLKYDDIKIFFSGSKGFHIGINSFKFGFKPSVHLPEQMRFAAHKIADLFQIDIDRKIYNHSRLWRIPDTVHAKTKLLKTELTYNEFKKSIDVIIKLSSSTKKRFPNYVLGEKCNSIKTLVKITKQIEKKVQKTDSWERPIQSEKANRIVKEALEYLLKTPVEKGSRDNETLLRASECRKVGMDKDECHDLISAWNKTNKYPISKDDVDRIVGSAYTGKGYDFGTNNESLKEARLESSKHINSEDDGIEDNDEFVRKPLTFRELLKNPNAGEMPEAIGDWLSWKGRITLLVGFAKLAGKSTICTYECMSALNKKLTVLWISHDEPQDDIIRRFTSAGLNKNCETLFIAGDNNAPKSWKEIKSFIDDVEPDLIILDSIHSIFSAVNGGVPDSSESAEWQKLTAKLRPVAIKYNAGIVWIHHMNKSGTSTGSIGIIAAVDVIVDMKQVSQKLSTCRDLEYLGRFVNGKMNKRLRFLGDKEGYEHLEFSTSNHNSEKTEDDIIAETIISYFKTSDTEIEDEDFIEMLSKDFGELIHKNKKKVFDIVNKLPIEQENKIWRLRTNGTKNT